MSLFKLVLIEILPMDFSRDVTGYVEKYEFSERQ